MITAFLNMSEPLYAGYNDRMHLSSFENYKVEAMKEISQDAAYIPDDATLRDMYESARNDTIARAMHHERRDLTVSSIILVLSIVLFTIHWMWMRRLEKVVSLDHS